MPFATAPLHLAVALADSGWHPAARREQAADAEQPTRAGFWLAQLRTAERGLLDIVTFEDPLAPRPGGDRLDRVRVRLDPLLLAARMAPATAGIGLLPTATTSFTEPFHVSTAVATLDVVSGGRAGWLARVSAHADEAIEAGRGELSTWSEQELFDDAADHVEVVRRLWDSWEDGAEIRDVAGGRFIDRERIHHIDFVRGRLSVRGPSITPRPPQGQPPIAALARTPEALRFAGAAADVVLAAPQDPQQLPALRAVVADAQAQAGRSGATLHLFVDLAVVLDADERRARERLARLDARDGATWAPGVPLFAGTPARLADELLAWRAAGATGVRLLPAALPRDLDAIADGLVPELQAREAFRRMYEATTLRGLLGLPRPANRYSARLSTASQAAAGPPSR
ncbi:LLM class flavin-dependent oxidoreductase [Conexibacter sp. CPCC 206217]|uniref:LLM class flavin-dependent oxidoreductase n=1 Tax=Conexibacter sp. CPCC 206217 TaxID=3064574 RepID=UPI002727D213|nr:LLM class flavin-dependent oxidoreductase [Conexibacter sp. CPCC 206217]MDO8208831.1 LLM class flavin-dependent oxidoreductase [Conexibacter sp. CPCC 206217]